VKAGRLFSDSEMINEITCFFAQRPGEWFNTPALLERIPFILSKYKDVNKIDNRRLSNILQMLAKRGVLDRERRMSNQHYSCPTFYRFHLGVDYVKQLVEGLSPDDKVVLARYLWRDFIISPVPVPLSLS